MKNNYQDKKVLILGLGLNQGGVGSAKFFAKAGAKVKVTDLKTKEELKPSMEALSDFPDIEYVLGEHRENDIDWADLIIRNPALKEDNQYLIYANRHQKEVEMDIGIFLQFVKPQQIVGVTGTKGKSTTTSLIYEVFKESNSVLFAGNIGKSVLDTVPYIKEDTLILLELSSFQLQAFHKHQFSPKWAVLTNIFPDHLNYHGTMENYIESKKAIAKYQTNQDLLFLPKKDQILDTSAFKNGLKGQINYFSPGDLPENFSPILPGEHNLWNIAAALKVADSFGINKNQALNILKNFKGVEFRLQLIKEVNGLKIYNDSAATNPESTIQALQSLPGSILICGGMNKGLSYDQMAEAISKYAKAVYFLEGDATDEILHQFKIKNLKFKIIQGSYQDLSLLLKSVAKTTQPKDIILFSPGATSFNLFQNEFDRGKKFNEAVTKILS